MAEEKRHKVERSIPPLVNTAWVAQHIDDPQVRVIDARTTSKYIEGHIRNSVSASFKPSDYLSYGVDTSYGCGCDLFTDPQATLPFQDGSREMLEEVLGKLGISNDTIVVAVGSGARYEAARFFWTLDYCGHRNLCILDGGIDKWLADGLSVTERVPKVSLSRYCIETFDQSKVAHTNFILENLTNPQVVLVDCLPSTRYSGGHLDYCRCGHLPGAKSLPWAHFLNDDGTFKSAAELRPLYENFGVTKDKHVITYCGGNPASSVGYFTLRYILGYPHVSVYKEAMHGWCQDLRNLPLDTYGVPALLRDAQWLNWWAGRAIQHLINNPRARVIDVRSRAEYEKGHIPFSVNLPVVEMLQGGAALPPRSKLATMLGHMGITRWNHVIIYDNNDGHLAAWLFWLLEYYGHEMAGILNGGLKAWEEKGFEVTQEIPVISQPKSIYSFDVAIPPGKFVAEPQSYRIASPSWLRRNLNKPDKVFVHTSPEASHASGTVNIEWTDNIVEKGTFKSALELTNMYEDAGVSKTREVVCLSPYGPDAAHTYFTLRLLGYPRVRLCRLSN